MGKNPVINNSFPLYISVLFDYRSGSSEVSKNAAVCLQRG